MRWCSPRPRSTPSGPANRALRLFRAQGSRGPATYTVLLMCGIIAVVRRPTDRQPPTAAEITGPLAVALRDLDAVDPTVDDPAVLAEIALRIVAVDRQMRGAAGVAALVTDPPLLHEVVHLARAMGERVAAIDEQLDTLELDARLIDEARGIEAVNASLVGLKDAVWAIEHDRVRTAQAVRELAPAESSAAAITAYLSIQQALSALDRLEVRGRDSAGLYVLVRNHGLDLGSGSMAAELAQRSGDPLFASGGVELAARSPRLRLQGGGRDRRARRQHRGAARRRSLADELLRRAVQAADGRGGRARPHPVGQRRHHLAGQRPPARTPTSSTTRRRGRPVRGAVRHRGAQRRRRQLRRPQGDRGPADPGRDHDRRQGDPDARVAEPGRRRCPLVESFRRCVDLLEGSVAIGASSATAPGRPALRPARQRSGAVRGPGRRRLHRRRPSPTAWSRRPIATSASTARRRPTSTTPARRGARSCASSGAAAGTIEGIERLAYDGAPLPVRESRAGRGADHDPRHRPWRLAALPAEGDHRGAGLVPQDPARQAGRARRRRCRWCSPRRRCPRDAAGRPRGRSDAPGHRHRSGHRGRGRPEPGRRARGRGRRRRPAAGAGDARHRAVRVRPAPPTCPTRWWSPSASPARRPTPTARSISSGPAALGSSRSSTGATAT